MLSLLGYLMVITFLVLIMTKRLSPFIALASIPIIFGVIGGFGLDLGGLIMEGLTKISPTAILLMFAILYFGIMIDAGLFDPLVTKILKIVKGDPVKVIVGSAILPGIIGFDGDGSTTMMICITAFLPLYKRLGINPVILASLTILQIGITTLVPWGGPAGRVATALKLDATDLYLAILPGMIVSLFFVVFAAYLIGKREQARLKKELSYVNLETYAEMAAATEIAEDALVGDADLKRPKLIWINLILSSVIMLAIVLDWFPAPALFIVGTALALLINYPSIEEQRKRLAEHAPNALAVVAMIFAAGVFTGILKGTGMSEAMAQSLVALIPTELGSHMVIITAIISAPGFFFLGPDGFYFGILPVLTETAASYGISAMEMGTASLMGVPFGVMGPLVASVYLLIGMTGIGLGDLHKYTAKWACMIMLIYIVVGLLLGDISL